MKLAVLLSIACAWAAMGGAYGQEPSEGPPDREPARPEVRRPGDGRGGWERQGHRERRGQGGLGTGRERGRKGQTERFMESHDRNRDGEVSFDEFQAGEKIQMISEEGRRRIFDHLDKNGDGKIVRSELPSGPPPAGAGGPAPGDTNRDGKISPEEFAQDPRLKEVPAARRQELFQRMDRNEDGFLSPADWRQRRDPGRRWGRGPMVSREAIEKLDTDGDQALSFDEWRADPRVKDIPDDRLKEMFEAADRNGDGVLSVADRPGPPLRRGSRDDGPPAGKPDREDRDK